MPTLLLHVDGLGPGDEERIEHEIRAMTGVFGVVASRAAGRVDVDFEDDEVGIDRILERIKELGFEARVAG